MAVRSPTEFHDRWPDVANATLLPNVFGSPTQSDTLTVGDRAWDLATSQYFNCVVPTLNAAIWLPAGGGGSTQDHQTARIIVGNQPAGDTLFVCDFLDPGDGTGIDAAIAAANVLASVGTFVDLHIRAGTYNLSPALCATGFVLAGAMKITGAGSNANTYIIGGSSAVMSAPIFNASVAGGLQLFDIMIGCFGSTAPLVPVVSLNINCVFRNVRGILAGTVDQSAFFGMSSGYPDGVVFDSVEVLALGVLSDPDFAGIRIDTNGQRGAPQAPLRISGYSYRGSPSPNFVAGIFLVDVAECALDSLSVVDVPMGLRLLYVAGTSGFNRGPQVRGLYHRVDNSAYQGFAVQLYMNSPGTVELIGASFSDVSMEGGPGSPAGANYLFDVEVQSSSNTLTSPTMQGTGRSSTGPQSPKVYVASIVSGARVLRPRLVNVAIENELRVQATVVGSLVDSPLLMGTEEGDLLIDGAGVINAQGVANRIRGTYTDTGTGTTVSIDIIGP